MVTAYPPQPAKSTELGLVSAQTMTPAEVLAPLPNASKVDVKSEAVFSPAGTSSTDPSSFLNRDKFLGAGELDESAKASNAFEDALEKALPRSFDSIVLEFFIDENGQIVQLTCIEGDCSTELSKQLEQLLLIPLTAAIKNGQPVPSRKVIQVSPTPTFGL